MRIIAGHFKGKRLKVPSGFKVRPTSDRVREALFSMIGEKVKGASVLDLFAGSGALGIEALSRGAASSVFVENSRSVSSFLFENILNAGVKKSLFKVVISDSFDYLKKAGREGSRFDLVFIDPAHELRIRAAWVYYIEGLTQQETASILGINRVQVTRLLAEARKRGEVHIHINSDITSIIETERGIQQLFNVPRVIVSPRSDTKFDATRSIAAAAGRFISEYVHSNMTIGVGWGRTLYSSLPHITGRALENVRIISLLGGISQAKRFNPAEFAWQFAELFNGEGYLVPAPALVDSAETKHTLLEHCGINQIFDQADSLDVAFLSAGGITKLTTSYRLGHVSEAGRKSLIAHRDRIGGG